MRIARCFAHIHDTDDILCHDSFIFSGISQAKILLDQIQGKQQLVLLKQRIVTGFIAFLADDAVSFEQTAPLMDLAFLSGIGIQRWK